MVRLPSLSQTTLRAVCRHHVLGPLVVCVILTFQAEFRSPSQESSPRISHVRLSHWLPAGLGIPYNDNIHSYDARGSMSLTPGGDKGAKAKILDTGTRSRSEKLKYVDSPRRLSRNDTKVQKQDEKKLRSYYHGPICMDSYCLEDTVYMEPP